VGFLDKSMKKRGRKIVWHVFVNTGGFLSTVEARGEYATKVEAKAVAIECRRRGYRAKVEALNVAEDFIPPPLTLP
jgi:hypothetical protein